MEHGRACLAWPEDGKFPLEVVRGRQGVGEGPWVEA